MLARLADFLRATLDRRDTAEVPLSEEIAFTRQYLEIEEVRFGERLRVEVDVDPEARSRPGALDDPSAARGKRRPTRHRPARRAAERSGSSPPARTGLCGSACTTTARAPRVSERAAEKTRRDPGSASPTRASASRSSTARGPSSPSAKVSAGGSPSPSGFPSARAPRSRREAHSLRRRRRRRALGRRGIVARLARSERVRVVAECGDGRTAVDAVTRLAPDILFLDVRMPDLDGFGVVEALPEKARPHVVFVTAHDRHAVEAFRVRALDYLVKPIDDERFAQALARAVEAADASAAAPVEPFRVPYAGTGRPGASG